MASKYDCDKCGQYMYLGVCPNPACSQEEPWGLTPKQAAAIVAARAELKAIAKVWCEQHRAALALAFADEEYGGFNETVGADSIARLIDLDMQIDQVLYHRKDAYRKRRLRGVTRHRMRPPEPSLKQVVEQIDREMRRGHLTVIRG